MFGRGLGRSGLLEKQMQGYDVAQADQLNKANRERDLKLGELSSQMNLDQRQTGQQEQELIARRGLIESQAYDQYSQQAREQGNNNLARLFDMASAISAQEWQKQQAAVEQSRWQSEFGLKQQELAQSAAKATKSAGSGNYGTGNKLDSGAYEYTIGKIKELATKDYGRSDMLNYINQKSASLEASGVDIPELRKWVEGTYRWDKDGNQSWFYIGDNGDRIYPDENGNLPVNY